MCLSSRAHSRPARDCSVFQPGHQVRGYLRRVRERFVVHCRQRRYQRHGILWRDQLFGMMRAQVRRDSARRGGFVVTRVVETNGECLYRRCAQALHEGGDRARIDAARQQRAEADVGQHALLDRLQ